MTIPPDIKYLAEIQARVIATKIEQLDIWAPEQLPKVLEFIDADIKHLLALTAEMRKRGNEPC